MEEQVVIVNHLNEVVGAVPRSIMRAKVLLHRASYVVVINSNNKILIQKRSQGKDLYPGFLDPTTGGVVRVNETYEQNALRELEEELGITGSPIHFLFDFHFENDQCKVWGRAYWTRYDGKISLTDGEVEDFFFLNSNEISAFLEKELVMPDGRVVVERYLEQID